MALASSGTMSIGGTTTDRSINLELGRSATATSSLGETDLRTLAGVASGAISMDDFYGASASQAFTTIKAGYSFFTFTGGRGSTQYGFDAGYRASGSAPIGSISYTDAIVVNGTTLGTLYRASVDNVASGRHNLNIEITGTNSNSGWTNVTCTRISNSASTTFARTSLSYSYVSGRRQYATGYIFDSTGDLTAGGSSSGKHCKFWGDDTPSYPSTGTDSTFTGKIEFS